MDKLNDSGDVQPTARLRTGEAQRKCWLTRCCRFGGIRASSSTPIPQLQAVLAAVAMLPSWAPWTSFSLVETLRNPFQTSCVRSRQSLIFLEHKEASTRGGRSQLRRGVFRHASCRIKFLYLIFAKYAKSYSTNPYLLLVCEVTLVPPRPILTIYHMAHVVENVFA